MESDGDHFLAYYLTKEDETAVEFKSDRQALPVNGVSSTEVRLSYSISYKHQPNFASCLVDGFPIRTRLRSRQGGTRSTE